MNAVAAKRDECLAINSHSCVGGACLMPEVARRLPSSRRHPLVAVSASSVGSLANHSLCNCEAVLHQYGGEGGRLLAQSITMRRVCRPDNQQTQLLLPSPPKTANKWELRFPLRSEMTLRSGSVTLLSSCRSPDAIRQRRSAHLARFRPR